MRVSAAAFILVLPLSACSGDLGVSAACSELEKFADEVAVSVEGVTMNMTNPPEVHQYGNRLYEIGLEMDKLEIADEELASAASSAATGVKNFGQSLLVWYPTSGPIQGTSGVLTGFAKIDRLCT